MASNPMQRQARNSFLLGMVIAILIAAVIIAILFIQMKKVQDENSAYKASLTRVYVLTQDVKSGDVLTNDMFIQVEVPNSAVPANYVNISSLLDAYSLYTKEGVRIVTQSRNGEQYLALNDTAGTEVHIDETGRFYIESNNSRQYIETVEAPVLAKIDVSKNSIITQAMITRSDEIKTNDVRTQEYNTIVLPIDLVTGDYIDIRLKLPNGQDFIVVSKKRVIVPEVDGEFLADTVQLEMTEDEILTMSSAIVENWYMTGSMLYANKYVEAGIQSQATPTYVVNNEVANLIDRDPNIINTAKQEMSNRYSNLTDLRSNYINPALSTYGNGDGISSGTDSSIAATLEARQEYLQSLVIDSTN